MESPVEVLEVNGHTFSEKNGNTTVDLVDVVSVHSSKKRSSDDAEIDGNHGANQRVRLQSSSTTPKAESRNANYSKKGKDRWRTHRMSEDYVSLVGDIMYPRKEFGPYGYNPEKSRFPIDRITTLGFLLSPIRQPTVIEKWNPYEIAVFEAALTLHGKNFNQVQKYVQTKNVKEIIEFYYDWKKTSHYKQWKDSYKPDEREVA